MTRTFQQSKILLVDDNDMGRQMVRALLENIGIDVVEAGNGLDAIDKVAAEEFDLVLMDVQMPVLDGRSATREIRNLDCPYSKTLPIIAMTANSYSEFRVESLAAGMNGHLEKPIDLKVLCAELKRWLPHIERHQLDTFLTQPEADFAALAKLLPRVDVKSGLQRVAGDQKLYLDLLARFVENFSAFAAEFLEFIKRGEKTEAVRYVHTLKGVAGGLGATALQHLAGKLESQFVQTEKSALLADVVEELSLLLADMDMVLKLKNHPTAVSPAGIMGTDKEFRTLLGQLEEPLLNLKVQQVHEILFQIKGKQWPQKYHSTLNEVESLIEQYQFAPAAGFIADFLAKDE